MISREEMSDEKSRRLGVSISRKEAVMSVFGGFFLENLDLGLDLVEEDLGLGIERIEVNASIPHFSLSPSLPQRTSISSNCFILCLSSFLSINLTIPSTGFASASPFALTFASTAATEGKGAGGTAARASPINHANSCSSSTSNHIDPSGARCLTVSPCPMVSRSDFR